MRKMMRTNVDITSRNSHVLRQFMLDCEVTLVSVGVFEVLLNIQCKWKNWSKAREGLVVESLTSSLILRRRGSAGRTVNSRNRSREIANNNCPLEHLYSVQQ